MDEPFSRSDSKIKSIASLHWRDLLKAVGTLRTKTSLFFGFKLEIIKTLYYSVYPWKKNFRFFMLPFNLLFEFIINLNRELGNLH